MSYVTWDTETTTKLSYKRLANPFDADNWVVTHGWKHNGSTVQEHRFGQNRPGPGWFAPVLAGAKLLIGFNLKFDLLHALQDPENLRLWMKWVADGGMVWDCQLAEYLLQGMTQKDHMLSLDEVAPRYGGNIKFDEVKVLWANGVRTEDIEPTLLTRYLLGGNDEHGVFQMGDIENTEKIALEQIARARKVGQLNSILLNMGSLIGTTEKERNGMFVDKAQGLVLADELATEIAALHTELSAYLPVLPFEFNWGSSVQKSALIFGGNVGYDRREYRLTDDNFTFSPPTPECADLYLYPMLVKKMVTAIVQTEACTKTMQMPEEQARSMNVTVERFASGKKKGEIKYTNVKVPDFDNPKSRMGRDTFTFPRITEPKKAWAGATAGVWSTSGEVIEELGNRNIPFLKALAKLTKMTKDLGTYFIITDEETGKSKGMLSLVNEQGIIHHRINHTSTVTGRFSSSDPNLQNIPKGNKSKVKLLFQSRYGGKIVQSDFSSLEIYVQAILTGDKQLIEDLRAGVDLHCMRLAITERKPYDDVVKLCKGYTNSDGILVHADPVWDQKRNVAKVFSFQRAYGAGATKISDSTGMSIEEVHALIEAENTRWPSIETYYLNLTEKIKRGRRLTGKVVPHPEVRGIMCNLGVSTVRTPDGKLYTYMEQPSPEYLVKKGIFASFSPTEIKNYVVQGEGGEWAKAAEYLAVRAFYARENFGGLACLVNQVHDAQYADAHETVAEDAAALLHACMEGASDYMDWTFKWQLPLPVPSDTTWGSSMMDEDPIPGVKDKARQYREELRRLYMGGHVPSYLKLQGV